MRNPMFAVNTIFEAIDIDEVKNKLDGGIVYKCQEDRKIGRADRDETDIVLFPLPSFDLGNGILRTQRININCFKKCDYDFIDDLTNCIVDALDDIDVREYFEVEVNSVSTFQPESLTIEQGTLMGNIEIEGSFPTGSYFSIAIDVITEGSLPVI